MPIIPQGATPINAHVGIFNDGEDCVYLLGMYPVYRHREGDPRGFRLAVAQLVDSGACRASEVCRSCGISKSNMDRTLRRYRAEGIEGFFVRKPPRRSGRVLTEEVLARARELIAEGLSNAEVAEELGVAKDTLRRAVYDGRLEKRSVLEVTAEDAGGSDKSQRSVEDAQAGGAMGVGCTREGERVLAAMGKLQGSTTQFEHARDVPYGGVLCALGALLANGLLGPARECLGKVGGYYTASQVLLLLGFMSLCRIKTAEQLRGKAPGEMGKLMGLDRVPEVRCLRAKLDAMSEGEGAEKYAATLSRQWMEADPEAVGTLYVDGHVRVYHGGKTKLPRKYVSRQRLCLRGTTDYWVNDSIGRPFFVIDKVVDSGLLTALREDIVPRLLCEVPGQPGEEQLRADPYLCRFTLIFDREGYSPVFFKQMWKQHRIACVTYHKHPGAAWRDEEFAPQEIHLSSGESITPLLAERGSLVGTKEGDIWLREVRKLTASGHQVSLIGTAYRMEGGAMAAGLFSRWCQENFFRYAMQHFAIDLLNEYGTVPLHDTETVVNPAWRQLERQRNALETKLRYRRASLTKCAHQSLPAEEEKIRLRERRQAERLEEIHLMEAELTEIKARKKQTPNHIQWVELPEEERFEKPMLARKHLLDAVHMIAYRAETALCGLLRSPTVDNAAARRILQDLFLTEADIRPDPEAGVLHVQIHRASRPVVDRALAALCEQLNEMETEFPASGLVMRYRLLGEPPPPPPAENPENGVNPTSRK